MENGSEEVTRVKIYNQTYDLRGTDSEYINKLAGYLDQKMTEISRSTTTVDTARVAILAALTILDEYMTTEKKLDSLEQEVSRNEEELVSRLKALVDGDSVSDQDVGPE